ncbi:MAG TPA: hypothetical protein VM820_17695 [Vicinamibacterales bacterium]|jgi:hypothetical protein|nr:hypothetical protein [Vicinamibacterales bacterium]
MTTLTLDKPEVVRKIAEAYEDGARAARKTLTRTVHDLEDLRDDAVVKVRKAPLAAVGLTFGIGFFVGVATGWAGHRPSR